MTFFAAVCIVDGFQQSIGKRPNLNSENNVCYVWHLWVLRLPIRIHSHKQELEVYRLQGSVHDSDNMAEVLLLVVCCCFFHSCDEQSESDYKKGEKKNVLWLGMNFYHSLRNFCSNAQTRGSLERLTRRSEFLYAYKHKRKHKKLKEKQLSLCLCLYLCQYSCAQSFFRVKLYLFVFIALVFVIQAPLM